LFYAISCISYYVAVAQWALLRTAGCLSVWIFHSVNF